MTPFSSVLMIKALDSLMLRQQVAAENLANASTQGYRPRRVDFEAALAEAGRGGLEALERFKPAIEAEIPSVMDQGVRVDQELLTSSASAGRYSALVEIMSRQMEIASLPLTRS
jgi:flagellar basal-body rod protein FlgB